MDAIALANFDDLKRGRVVAGRPIKVTLDEYQHLSRYGLARAATSADPVAAPPVQPIRGWDTRPLVIVASGPSLTKRDCNRVVKAREADEIRVLVINDNWKMVGNADVLYACDLAWWVVNHAQIKFDGMRYTQTPEAAHRYGLEYVPGENKPGLSRDPARIHTGCNSGYQALNLAYHFGSREIALLGYDFQCTDGKAHWFGNHPEALNNPTQIGAWIPYMDALAADLEAAGVAVTNCTRETALECFRKNTIFKWLSDKQS